MSCKITYRGSLPKKVRDEVRPLVQQYRFLLPPWLNTLTVMYHQDQEAEASDDIKNHVAYTTAEWEYRQAKLVVCPRWNDVLPEGRAGVIAHELIHVLLAPMQTWTDDYLREGVSDDEHRAVLEEQWRRMMEMCVEDAAQIVIGRERKRK